MSWCQTVLMNIGSVTYYCLEMSLNLTEPQFTHKKNGTDYSLCCQK